MDKVLENMDNLHIANNNNKSTMVSVVMPLYNSEGTIAKVLDAIFANTFKNFEVIIVDDGSTDKSSEIAKKYPVKLFRQENAGQSKARNVGVNHADTDIIVFIDSDVIIPDYALEKIYNAFSRKGVEIIGGMPDSKNHYKNKISDYENLYIHYQFNKQNNTTTAFYTSLVAIRKKLFQKFNGFDERIRIPEDMELGQRLLEGGHIIYLDKNIQFSHLSHFTFISYIKKQIKKTSGILKIKLRNLKIKKKNKKCYDASLLFQLGIPISLLIPICLLIAIIIPSVIPVYISLVVLVVLVLINKKMISYIYHKRNFIFFITSCLFLVFNYWLYFIGLSYGITSFIFGKEY